MKTKCTIIAASFLLSFSQFSLHAQCGVTIKGKAELNSNLTAQYGACKPDVLLWQLNGQTVYTAYEIQFKKHGYVAAGGNDYGSAANQLAGPGDVHVDGAGNVYVLDGYNNRVQMWASGASQGVTVAGGHGLGSAANQLFLPQGFFVDKTGNIYIADLFNNRVQKWAPGAISGITVAGGNGYGTGANQLESPHDVFVDASGNIFISDGDNNRVQKWAPGALSGTTVAGGNGYGSAANQLKTPFSLFVNTAGDLYISDRVNNRIQKWAAGASAGVTVAGGVNGEDSTQLNDPRGLYVDSFGRIYIADYFNNRIQKWIPGMSFGVTVAGGRGAGYYPGQLFNGSGVCISPAGELYVADEGNNRVQKYVAFPHDINCKFIPNIPGTYRVVAVYPDGSMDTSAEMSIAAAAVSQPSTISVTTPSKAFSLYPNPAHDFTIIKIISDKEEKFTAEVTNMYGKVLLRKEYNVNIGENLIRVDLNSFAVGAYLVNLSSSEKSIQTLKLSKL